MQICSDWWKTSSRANRSTRLVVLIYYVTEALLTKTYHLQSSRNENWREKKPFSSCNQKWIRDFPEQLYAIFYICNTHYFLYMQYALACFNNSVSFCRFVLCRLMIRMTAGFGVNCCRYLLGPFVMNTREQIQQAMMDYSTGKNGFEKAQTWKSHVTRDEL